MKIRLVYTVEVDPDAWSLSFGCGVGEAAVREDVKKYFLEQIRFSPPAEECSLTAERSN